MEGTRSGTQLTGSVLAAVIVALLAFIVLSAVLDGTFSAAHLWSAIGHHPVLEADGNLASLAQGRTAWARLVQGVFLLAAAALWLAAVIRQTLSWRQLKGAGEAGEERRQQLKWLASGAAVRTDLTGVVYRALEPDHVSVWLSHRD